MRERVLERFLRYITIDTTSDSKSESYPSTESQREFLALLAKELREIGCSDVVQDEYGYVTATIEATAGRESEPVIGFLAHVDTSPEMCGNNIEHQIVENFNPEEPLRLGSSDYFLTKEEFPELSYFKGHTLITTKGETLLGADDKAGVAEILCAAEELIKNRELSHGKIRIAFTADEEIGRGVDYFDVESFGADFAYTIDSGGEGCLEYENFNAARATISAVGRNIHPGYAKDKMVNALETLMAIHSGLPPHQRPEHTVGYEGFFHLLRLSGTIESAESEYIIRDHSAEQFTNRIELLESLCKERGVELDIKVEYRNMREIVEKNMEIVERAERAIAASGAKPLIMPIRGGTDGARLSYMGLPCPNIFTGGMNFHSRYEYASLESMVKAVNTIINIAVGV